MKRKSALALCLVLLGLALATPASAEMGACASAYRKMDPEDQIRLYTACITGGDMTHAKLGGAFNNRGVAYLALPGNEELALSDFTRAIHYQPRWATAYLNRAAIYFDRAQYELALADLDQAVKLRPTRTRGEAYYFRALTHLTLNNTAAALPDLDQALRYERKNVSYRLAKVWLLASHPDSQFRDGATALEEAQLALKWDEGWQVHDALAAAYAELGQFPDAIREQETALTLVRSAGNPDAVDEAMAERLASYQRGEPWREPVL